MHRSAELIELSEFQALSREHKRDYLQNTLSEYRVKDLLRFWGMKYPVEYYTLLKREGLHEEIVKNRKSKRASPAPAAEHLPPTSSRRKLKHGGTAASSTSRTESKLNRVTGMTRRIDSLGRIVIPQEIKTTLKISEGDALEVFHDEEQHNIILKKYTRGCFHCGSLNHLFYFKEKYICGNCKQELMQLLADLTDTREG